MSDNLPAPREGREVESGGSRRSDSSSRRTSSGNKVKSSGGCLLPVILVAGLLALLALTLLL